MGTEVLKGVAGVLWQLALSSGHSPVFPFYFLPS